MRSLANDYVSGSKASVRDILVQIKLNDEENTVYEMDKLMPITVNRKITDGSFGIGFTPSDRISFSAAATEKISKKTRITLYNSFGGTYERLGRFYCETSPRSGSMITVTAFDAMNLLRTRTVKFTGISSKDLPALAFPCTMQDVLDYIVIKNGLTCEFVCQPFTVQEKPMKSDTEYYSDAEILGFIASAHASNARFDYEGKLTFVGYTAVSTEFTASNVIDMTTDDSEPFTVTGILFKVGNDTIYIDDVDGSEYDDTAAGVIKVENPFASIEVAEYVWSQLGGMSYYGGTLKLRGAGILECGDVITVRNLKNPSDTAEYPMCITGITYTIGGDGFIETISSEVNKSGGTSLSSNSSSGSGGKEYYAGEGLTLTDGNAFQLNYASQSTRGGMYMAAGEWVAEDDETADAGIYIGSEHLGALRTATRYQKGGFFLGDGLVPVLEEGENSSGETVYSASDYVELRLGDGLYFIDKNEAETDTKEKRRNHYGGRAVAVSRATAEKFGIVKLGKRLGIDTDGSAYVALFEGDGIDISDSGIIAVKIDNETITVNDDGKLEAAGGVTVENAIVIKEADAKLLVHEYTEVEYIAGNKIVYGGHGNPVIASGLVCWLYKNASPNGVVVNTVNSAASADKLPDVPVYQTVSFSTPAYVRGTAAVSNVDKITVELTEHYTDYAKFCTYAWSGGTKTQISTDTIWNGQELGICFAFKSILAPGTYQGMEFPYGAVVAYPFWKYARGASSLYFSGFSYDNYIPFASEAEYNAAVQLTTEPQTLTEVQETVTEV